MDDRTQCSLPTVVLANKSDLRGEGVGVRGEEDLHMETLVSGRLLEMRLKNQTHPPAPHIHSMRHLEFTTQHLPLYCLYLHNVYLHLKHQSSLPKQHRLKLQQNYLYHNVHGPLSAQEAPETARESPLSDYLHINQLYLHIKELYLYLNHLFL